MAIACRPNEVPKNSAVVTSEMDKDTSFRSDIKSLHRLLDLEKNKEGEGRGRRRKKKKKGPALIKFTDCTSVIFPSSLIGG